jgi:hypothetical protein
MPSQEVNEQTQAEWRSLGFFYDRDDTSHTWRIVGSAAGIERLTQLIRQYAHDPRNERLSEHEHYGPYQYLEIGTAARAEINAHWIAGSLAELANLASLIEQWLGRARVGDTISLRASYAPDSSHELMLELRDEAFDPAREDPHCW